MHRFPLVVAALSLVLAGCGGSGTPAAAPTKHPSTLAPLCGSDATPAAGIPAPDGPRITGHGYSLSVPKGWRDVTGKLKAGAGQIDRAAADRSTTKGFAANVNVVITGGGAGTRAQLDAAAEQIRQAFKDTAPHYRVLPHATLAGCPAAHLAGVRTQQHTRYWLDQYIVIRRDKSVIVSFSFSPSVPATQRRKTIISILNSWKWS